MLLNKIKIIKFIKTVKSYLKKTMDFTNESNINKVSKSPVLFNNYFDDILRKSQEQSSGNTLFLYIVYLHRSIGQTYGGWQTSKGFSKIKRYFLITYELFTVCFAISMYYYFENAVTLRLFDSAARKVITAGILRLAGSVSLFQIILIRAILFINGNQLIDEINALFKSLNKSISYRSVILFYLTHCISTGITSALVFASKDFKESLDVSCFPVLY